jgi:hypothetical protein
VRYCNDNERCEQRASELGWWGNQFEDKIEGYLEVGRNDIGQVVIELDRNHTQPWLVELSPAQAATLADILLTRASQLSPAFSARAYRLEEHDRQAILLALGILRNQRPGWDYMLGLIADKFSGREMMEEFSTLNLEGCGCDQHKQLGVPCDRDQYGVFSCRSPTRRVLEMLRDGDHAGVGVIKGSAAMRLIEAALADATFEQLQEHKVDESLR